MLRSTELRMEQIAAEVLDKTDPTPTESDIAATATTMSSTISTTELIQTLQHRPAPSIPNSSNKMAARTLMTSQQDDLTKKAQQRLVRTTSIEKIRKFNTFICSQQYYILPALLAWLRSSQNVLHSATEKTIFVFRAAIFNGIFYNIYKLDYKSLVQQTRLRLESVEVLRTAVYLVGLALVSQLTLCVYLLAHTYVPSGLVFLILCMLYINYLHYRASFFYVENRVSFKKDK